MYGVKVLSTTHPMISLGDGWLTIMMRTADCGPGKEYWFTQTWYTLPKEEI